MFALSHILQMSLHRSVSLSLSLPYTHTHTNVRLCAVCHCLPHIFLTAPIGARSTVCVCVIRYACVYTICLWVMLVRRYDISRACPIAA